MEQAVAKEQEKPDEVVWVTSKPWKPKKPKGNPWGVISPIIALFALGVSKIIGIDELAAAKRALYHYMLVQHILLKSWANKNMLALFARNEVLQGLRSSDLQKLLEEENLSSIEHYSRMQEFYIDYTGFENYPSYDLFAYVS